MIAPQSSTERILLLARHGETEWNREGRWQGQTDVPLNDAGRVQAEALAHLLRPLAPRLAVASDLSRAFETASIVASRLALPTPASRPDLRERSYGVFEGLTRDECEIHYPADWAEWKSGRLPDPPGAEPRQEVGRRVRAALEAVVEAAGSDPRPVLVVSHGGSIRAFLLVALALEVPPIPNGGAWEVRWSAGEFFGAQRVESSPGR